MINDPTQFPPMMRISFYATENKILSAAAVILTLQKLKNFFTRNSKLISSTSLFLLSPEQQLMSIVIFN